MRSGFTLVEILIAAVLAVTIGAGALSIFGLTNRSRGVTGTARALQTALIVQETFTDDLSRLVQMGGAPLRFWPEKPSRLSFVAYEPETARAPGLVVPVHAVVWSLDAPGSYLKRQAAGIRESVGVSPLTSIAFTPFLSPTGPLVRVALVVGRDKGDVDGPPTHYAFLARIPSPRPHPSLKFQIKSWFTEKSDEPGAQLLPGP